MTENKPFNSEFGFSGANYAARTLVAIAKYVTLLGGIYSVCKDDKDFIAASVWGMGYIAADAVKEAIRDVAEISKFSILEKKLKK